MVYVVQVLVEKKSLKHPKADAVKRATFISTINTYEQEGRPIIYLDESGFPDDMPRTHGYSKIGQRCYGIYDWESKKRTNIIGALLGTVLLTATLYTENMNTDRFYQWITKELLPKVEPKTIIVMDNVTFHRRKDIRQAIEQKECILQFQPSYSPDLNPIEQKWAQMKKYKRKQQCTVEKTVNHFLRNNKMSQLYYG